MQNISIKIKNYKCFSTEAGFECLKRINVIIGRNNSGKSSLLDIIEHVSMKNYEFDASTWRDNKKPQIIFKSTIPEEVTSSIFSSSKSGGVINGCHLDYGKLLAGSTLRWSKSVPDKFGAKLIECDAEGLSKPVSDIGGYTNRLINDMPIYIEGKIFKKILAERDIVSEIDNQTPINIHSNGIGITHAIQCFINRSNLPSKLVEVKLLEALNEIFAHDATFTDIVCQLHDSGKWEIYLEEENKGRVQLSRSGSGLKTVIMVISYLILLPNIEKKELNQYVFAFEELENNIHPALLRRLNNYIYKKSIDENFMCFLTTHSNVLIDQFSKQKDAQILHVVHNTKASMCKPVMTYIERNGILDDLDIRASDLLQANGIIWVEGPSDRIYVNKWIELWSDGRYKEGTHYQCIFYGGKLLSHLSAKEPDEIEAGISIFNVNKNSIILIDSDKKAKQSSINKTKKRIIKEFEALNSHSWVTKGKEIENYIPKEAVDSYWKVNNSNQVGQYDSFFDHLDSLKKNEGKRYFSKKTLMAENIVQFISKDNISPILDMQEQLNIICRTIGRWNN